MRVLFMGTPEFAVPSLEGLVASEHEVLAVLTQPDRPKGRKRVLTPSPVRAAAEAHGLQVLTPETFRRNDALYAELAAMQPDIAVVAAYGHLLPKRFLTLPKHECINAHASLLPRYRGASPINAALLNGDKEAGVTIMHMVKRMDAGAMYLKGSVPIEEDETTGTLEPKLAQLAAKLVLEALNGIADGALEPTPQDDEQATYVSLIQKADGAIDWSLPAERLAWHIRGYNPWPGASTILDGKRVTLLMAKPVLYPLPAPPKPGRIAGYQKGRGLIVETGDGALLVTELQAAGKKPLPGDVFYQGLRGSLEGEMVFGE